MISNFSDRQRFNVARYACVLICVVGVCLICAGCVPVLRGDNLSGGQITELSGEAAVQIETLYPPALLNTPGLDELTKASAKLAPLATGLPPYANLRFEAIESDEQLSISLPDGHVFVSSGLLTLLAQDPSAIDSVVAHEIGHVALQHDLTNLAAALGQSNLSSELAQGRYSDVVNTEIELGKLSYSRDQEFEADNYAIVLDKRAGYDPRGLEDLIKLVDNQDHASDFVTWDLSHPIGHGRLARISRQVDKISGSHN